MSTTTAAVEAVWRIESGRLVAALTRLTGDFSAAEDLAQDAFVQLLRHWSRVATYDAPGAWLRRVAIRMAVREDHRRKVRPLRDDGKPNRPLTAFSVMIEAAPPEVVV